MVKTIKQKETEIITKDFLGECKSKEMSITEALQMMVVIFLSLFLIIALTLYIVKPILQKPCVDIENLQKIVKADNINDIRCVLLGTYDFDQNGVTDISDFALVDRTEEVQIEYESIVEDLDTSFKTWMDYRKITNRNSKQYALQRLSTTDGQGFRRFDNDYLIALGSHFAQNIGQRLEITLSDGTTFYARLGDYKDDRHTDPTNRFIKANGNVIEFIVDSKIMDRQVLRSGTVSSLGFEGQVSDIVCITEVVD